MTCKPTDGIYSSQDSECQKCFYKAKNICIIFSKYFGLDESTPVKKRKAKQEGADEDEVIAALEDFKRKIK